MRVIDMHAHLFCFSAFEGQAQEACKKAMRQLAEEELQIRQKHGILTFFSSGTPKEWEFVSGLLTAPDCGKKYGRDLYRSFGIHPWYSDQYEPDEFLKYYQECDAIGEIGADSVWCGVPLERQYRIFQRQMELAVLYDKPVILHTKGQEPWIADQIQKYPGRVCIHWYSGNMQTLTRFRDAGCYFTLGPDLASCRNYGDQAAAERYDWMLREIPAERLFIETDGLVSIAWLREVHGKKEKANLTDIPDTLLKSLTTAAKAKNMEPEDLCERMRENLREFLGYKQICHLP
ncbi:MAG: TatD family hydrolase [Clostridiales bacterium]|nr:TatD family hydrolase [Clostridiales bacterium]